MDWSKILDDSLVSFHKKNEPKIFKQLSSNYDRIAFLINLPNQSFLQKIDQFLEYLVKNKIESKSADLSEMHKAKGNLFYAKSNYREAFKHYTLALSQAPYFKPIVLAYSNRSAVFFSLKFYQECLVDIETIKNLVSTTVVSEDLKFMYDGLALKILKREYNCLDKLKLPRFELKKPNNILIQFLSEEALLELEEIIQKNDSITEDKLSTKLSQNEIFLNPTKISECVEVKYNSSKGRYCVANRDIQVGDCLFVEKAYCAILLPEFNETYCQQCFKLIYDVKCDQFLCLNIEVCDACTSVFYCSNKCKLEDKNKHLFECKLLKSLMHNLGIAHLAYRILATTNFDILIEYSKKKSQEPGTNLNIDYNNSSDYEQIFHLLTHEEETHVDDLFKYSLTSLLLARHYTKVLTQPKSEEFLISISSILLKHLLQTICNAHAITQLRDDNKETKSGSTFNREQIRYATAIYPRVSLLNHSCNSNVLSSFINDSSTILVKAARFIPANKEIYNCYGPHYLKMSLFERQESLLEQYRFQCDCDSCMAQMSQLDKTKLAIKCEKCEGKETQIEYSNKNLLIKCNKCQHSLGYKELNAIFSQTDLELNNLIDLNFDEKIMKLKNRIKRFLFIDDKDQVENIQIDEYSRGFYMIYSKLLDIQCRHWCNLLEFVTASYLGEKNIKLLKLIHKNETVVVEIAHELFKLAEIQCNCSDVKIEESNLEIILIETSNEENNNETKNHCLTFKFEDFKLDKISFVNLKKNSPASNKTYLESIFRFKIKEDMTEDYKAVSIAKAKSITNLNELTHLKCLLCKTSLLRLWPDTDENKKFTVLQLPDNELDELADNFFCHLHEHCHGEHQEETHKVEDLTNVLNPLRNSTLRRSVLENTTLLVLNERHLNDISISINNNMIKCSKCNFNIGYTSKQDKFIWKSNTLQNQQRLPYELFGLLSQGRYLIETKDAQGKIRYIYAWILNDNSLFKHLKYYLTPNSITSSMILNLKDFYMISNNNSKKIMYKYWTKEASNDDKWFKELNNDFNLNNLAVSNEHFDLLIEVLKNSTNQLCESLQTSNDYYFAII